ncbi:MAG: fructose-bisphosphatase class III, partial [Bacteroidales bacterium]|nr:fructose-bisphosphatase class III [Bacteroidales bacterium]
MSDDIKYLELLSRSFPTIQSASTEITNLEAILNLPKGTEHFLTDLHGEYDAFQHILKNASGVIKIKVEEVFGHTIREQEKRELCALIYYPESKLKQVKEREGDNINDWYTITLVQIVKILEAVSSKYTRSKVRKALPEEYSYIIQELLHESSSQPDKQKYISAILDSIIETGSADPFIIAVSKVIHRLTIDSLHIIGDIYDRGPAAHLIMDTICEYHNCDIQWGNHDLVWMGAAAGSAACIANALRISLRYANLEAIEEGYGINLLPLATFAMEAYGSDPCKYFKPKVGDNPEISPKEESIIAKMHKAITIIQFKLEKEIIDSREEFDMKGRNLLHKIDFKRGTVELNGVDYPLKDTNFPTIDPTAPYKLTDEEQDVVKKLVTSFKGNEKLRKHINCLYSKGSLYLVRNGNLLYHGSML